jgi:hypothetical protein
MQEARGQHGIFSMLGRDNLRHLSVQEPGMSELESRVRQNGRNRGA